MGESSVEIVKVEEVVEEPDSDRGAGVVEEVLGGAAERDERASFVSWGEVGSDSTGGRRGSRLSTESSTVGSGAAEGAEGCSSTGTEDKSVGSEALAGVSEGAGPEGIGAWTGKERFGQFRLFEKR